jgi:hypothetical protein
LLRKTHKPAGEVSFRPVHATPNYSMMGLAMWLVLILRKKMNDPRFSFLLSDSLQFVRGISSMIPTGKSFFMKMDLKDFFMSGTSDELKNDVIAIFDPANEGYLRGLVSGTIDLLLSSQYVSAPCFPGRLWRVVRGAGMGLIFAGDMCDMALATRAELEWAACFGRPIFLCNSNLLF